MRALLRAAKYGNLSIMYPMIISVEEVVSIKKIVAEVAEELENENIPYEIPEQRFIKMGIDELSVSPSMVLGVRSRICEME